MFIFPLHLLYTSSTELPLHEYYPISQLSQMKQSELKWMSPQTKLHKWHLQWLHFLVLTKATGATAQIQITLHSAIDSTSLSMYFWEVHSSFSSLANNTLPQRKWVKSLAKGHTGRIGLTEQSDHVAPNEALFHKIIEFWLLMVQTTIVSLGKTLQSLFWVNVVWVAGGGQRGASITRPQGSCGYS